MLGQPDPDCADREDDWCPRAPLYIKEGPRNPSAEKIRRMMSRLIKERGMRKFHWICWDGPWHFRL